RANRVAWDAMRSRASRRTVLVNLVSLVVVLAGCLFVLLRRADRDEGLAFAAPAQKGAADAGGAAFSSDAGDAGAGVEPIDLAIAPDGGVPYHPEGTQYRSPFAKPNAGPPVRIKVGMLLNSVDEYDV